MAKSQNGKSAKKGKGPAVTAPLLEGTTPPAPSTFIVTAGSYERLLYGLSCTFVPSPSTSKSALPYELSVVPVFSFPAHLSSIRTVASSTLTSAATGSERKVGGKYLVSGGMDEIVKVWDLKRRKEVGVLEGAAAGTITCLRFVAERNMLLAASSDSTITLYRVRDWVPLRSLKGHKGRVNAIDAHPAGRVALSVGQDKMLRMWDLVAGKAVATLKIGTEGDVVRWNTDGTKFAVICGSTLTVYAIDMHVLHTLTAPSRFHDVHFCYLPIDASDPSQKEYFLVGCEDGKTRVFVVGDGDAGETGGVLEPVAILEGHANRVKMIDFLEVARPDQETTLVLTSVSSDGKINFYDLSALTAVKESESSSPFLVQPIASFDTDGSRLTCVCAVGMVEAKAAKGNAGGDEDDDEEEDEAEEDEEDSDDEEEDEEDASEDVEMEEEEEGEEEEEEWGGVEE